MSWPWLDKHAAVSNNSCRFGMLLIFSSEGACPPKKCGKRWAIPLPFLRYRTANFKMSALPFLQLLDNHSSYPNKSYRFGKLLIIASDSACQTLLSLPLMEVDMTISVTVPNRETKIISRRDHYCFGNGSTSMLLFPIILTDSESF